MKVTHEEARRLTRCTLSCTGANSRSRLPWRLCSACTVLRSGPNSAPSNCCIFSTIQSLASSHVRRNSSTLRHVTTYRGLLHVRTRHIHRVLLQDTSHVCQKSSTLRHVRYVRVQQGLWDITEVSLDIIIDYQIYFLFYNSIIQVKVTEKS